MIRKYIWWSALAVILALVAVLLLVPRLGRTPTGGEGEPRVLAEGLLVTPESVAVGPDGKYYASNLGRPGKGGDGFIARVDPESGKFEKLAGGLDDPKGVAFWEGQLYIADLDKVWRVSVLSAGEGEKELFLGPEDFPRRPVFLNDLVIDSSGNLYLSDTRLGAIFRVTPQGEAVVFASRDEFGELQGPNGLAIGPDGSLLVVDFNSGKLLRLAPDGSSGEVIGEGFGGGDGLALDPQGNVYISDYRNGKVFRRRPQGEVELVARGLESPADISLDLERGLLLVPEFTGNRLRLIPIELGG